MAVEGVNSMFIGQHKGNGVDSGNTQMVGRVIYTLLTDDPEQLTKMQVPSGSIGAIQFRMIYNGVEYGGSNFLVAYPLGHIKKFPVQNELVNIISRASNQASNPAGNTIPSYYYDDIIPLFDSPEHNALPSDKSFSANNGASITGPFIEKGNIYKLQHLPGDSIIDARFGQSIRFGNSHPDFSSAPWEGPQGNPVLTITNGQKKQIASNISAVYEDINGDGSSIWALNNHKIQFAPASTNFQSYGPGTTSTASKNNIIVANNQVVSAATSSLDNTDNVPVKDTAPVVYPTQTKTVDSPTPQDEVVFLPDKEEPEYTQEIGDLVVEVRQNFVQFPTAYTLKGNPTNKGGKLYFNKADAEAAIKKGAYPDLPVLNFEYTSYGYKAFADALKKYVDSGAISKNIARSILATGINEQTYGHNIIRGFNNDFFGIQSDLKTRWSLGPKYPNVKLSGQVFALEGETKSFRGYLAFTTLDDAIQFAIDKFYKKGFDTIPYDSSDSVKYAEKYVSTWYGAPMTPKLQAEKSAGYEKAKIYI